MVAFGVDRLVQRRQVAMIAAKSVPFGLRSTASGNLAPLRVWRAGGVGELSAFTPPRSSASLASLAGRPYVGLLALSLQRHRRRRYASFFPSIRMSFYSAAIGAVITSSSAYLIEKSRQLESFRRIA